MKTAALAPQQHVRDALATATGRIAPVWPLARFVAVNPYFGLADLPFSDAARQLARAGGARSTMSIGWYLAAVDDGRITVPALRAALESTDRHAPRSPEGFLQDCRASEAAGPTPPARVPTVARTASASGGRDWEHLMTDRISAWAASYFDHGQATWRPSAPGAGLYASWRDEASIDRTPEVMGLRGFRQAVRGLPDDPLALAARAAETLGLDGEALGTYLHALLMQVGGWSAHGAWIGFEAALREETDTTLVELAGILVAWELALFDTLAPQGLGATWSAARATADWCGLQTDLQLEAQLVLQDALDRSEQDRIAAVLHPIQRPKPEATATPTRAQAIFCIDVRSEVFRRHLEATGTDIETVGFAGFFGMAIEYVPIAHQRGTSQCPVLLRPSHTVMETAGDGTPVAAATRRRGLAHHIQRAWKSFKMGAISCFSFVGPVGLLYLPKLFTDSAGRTRPTARPDGEGLTASQAHARRPELSTVAASIGNGIALKDRVSLAEGMLRGTSLHNDLADVVLIVGHGASTANNPFESSLHCGACGGNTGEANARVAATILNDADVRNELDNRGLAIPTGTWFVAALHDTTTDDVALFDRASVPPRLAGPLAELESDLAAASTAARAERAQRLGLNRGDGLDQAVRRRSTDWAQVRPEWGLAGCRAFLAAPRHRTAGVDLGGNVFLHSYDWRRDDGFGVLELILTAPVVVASWISLQYFASTVEPDIFGAGNKTLHNVVGRMGVLEGYGGDLRTGLPWQSVHDGTKLQHQPLRLAVIIEAPLDAIDEVLAQHQHVADLCRNGWIQLLAMGEDGAVTHRYVASGSWAPA